jgi:hypothetical protein
VEEVNSRSRSWQLAKRKETVAVTVGSKQRRSEQPQLPAVGKEESKKKE